jgi:ATP-dependent DNA helicase RecG
MFDRDLQEVILAENKMFFEWARQQGEKPKEEPIKLSKYEDSVPAVEFTDLSNEALNLYQARAKFSAVVGSGDFQRLLRQQGILVETNNKLVPSGFGLILFGKNPSHAMPQARLLARAELADGKTSRMDFDQAMVLVPGKLEEWLNKVLPSTLDRSRMERREQIDLPFEMIREAVVNALIHRDYNIVEQKCQLVVNAGTITIKSPGGPISPITLDEMRSFTAPMKSRNPLLHYVFARMGMAEEQGFGLTSLKQQAEKLGLPLPSFTMEGDALVLTIYRSKAAAVSSLGQDVLKNLSKAERVGWEWLSSREKTTSVEYATAMKVPNRTALNHLKRFSELKLLEKLGSGSKTLYRVVRR